MKGLMEIQPSFDQVALTLQYYPKHPESTIDTSNAICYPDIKKILIIIEFKVIHQYFTDIIPEVEDP